MAALPPEGPPEVAFAGRSNVGKSSLINALTRQSGLARTSNTPGRTQALIFFVPDPPVRRRRPPFPPSRWSTCRATASPRRRRSKVAAWTALIRDYLRGRAR